jgi:hypothetical protein
MSSQENGLRGFTVSVKPADEAADAYVVGYVPHGLMQERGPNGAPKQARATEFRAHVQAGGKQPVRWDKPPADGKALATFDDDARTRVGLLHEWLHRINGLIQSVQGWAKELGWSTKVIAKPMDDSAIGNYRVPALLMQEEVTKVLLEPVARSSPGTKGVVDLYVMPGYDDIASLYFYGNRWHLHRPADETSAVAKIPDASAKPVTKAAFREVLEKMKTHAG